ncbi:hypothetical protein I79_022171 [Cricetulus griseus]|uniref:Secreted protein n=1 Tax=Cricetulus griseus TaxID=10029 RepID=G3IEM2_CRIGR|nr:hypothetical protein I79_022171 [Cricetulus griseus]
MQMARFTQGLAVVMVVVDTCPTPTCGPALKHYKENCIKKPTQQRQSAIAWSSILSLGQSHCTTPKTPEQSVSKGRICPWVHTPGPWTAMGTVCEQHRVCPFHIS